MTRLELKRLISQAINNKKRTKRYLREGDYEMFEIDSRYLLEKVYLIKKEFKNRKRIQNVIYLTGRAG